MNPLIQIIGERIIPYSCIVVGALIIAFIISQRYTPPSDGPEP